MAFNAQFEVKRESSVRGGNARKRTLDGGRQLAAPDPTTSDRHYSAEELELLQAMDRYQARTGRRYPSYCEVLAVLVSLGWRKES